MKSAFQNTLMGSRDDQLFCRIFFFAGVIIVGVGCDGERGKYYLNSGFEEGGRNFGQAAFPTMML